jgi:RNA polymerase sigma-70 factor (TIGR02960 family)
MNVPLSDRRPGVAGVLEKADGGYAENWAPPDRPVPARADVYLCAPSLSVVCERVEGDVKGEDMDTDLLSLARAGDEDAFGELVAPYRRELQVHCYRILGSLQDAEDVLQETLLSAWRGLAGFEERASVRTWLYRIATNRSLDAVRAGARRGPEMNTRIRGIEPPEPTRYTEVPWLQPYPDTLLADRPDPAPGPEAVIEQRESVSLAFVTALQLLPPRQRAVLILRDVLGYRAAEAAEILGTTVESVTSALKRARAALEADQDLAASRAHAPAPAPDSPEERRLVAAYMDAFADHDIDRLLALLTEDVWVKMPPMPYEYHGHADAIRFFTAIVHPDRRHLRTVPTRANGGPALGAYALDPATGTFRGIGIFVLVLAGDRICEITRFETGVMASFGLPRILP